LEIITTKTCRTHHRSCGWNEEARTWGTWSHATKIENIYRNDGGEASTKHNLLQKLKILKYVTFLITNF